MKTILIADDNYDFREMLRQFLGASGYRTLEATDGEQAVEVAARESPDIILMDLGLPGMDGLSAVTAIREQLPLAGVPILIVSASTGWSTAPRLSAPDAAATSPNPGPRRTAENARYPVTTGRRQLRKVPA